MMSSKNPLDESKIGSSHSNDAMFCSPTLGLSWSKNHCLSCGEGGICVFFVSIGLCENVSSCWERSDWPIWLPTPLTLEYRLGSRAVGLSCCLSNSTCEVIKGWWVRTLGCEFSTHSLPRPFTALMHPGCPRAFIPSKTSIHVFVEGLPQWLESNLSTLGESGCLGTEFSLMGTAV